MKNEALFSSKDKSKNLKCCLLQVLFGALRVKHSVPRTHVYFGTDGSHSHLMSGNVLLSYNIP